MKVSGRRIRVRVRDSKTYAATQRKTSNAVTTTWLYVPLSPGKGNSIERSFEVQPVEVMRTRTATLHKDETVQKSNGVNESGLNLQTMTAQQRTTRGVPFYVPAYEGALLQASERNAEMHRISNWETRNSAMDTTYLIASVAAIFATILAINLLFGLLLPILVKAAINFACHALSNNKLALEISRALALQLYFAL